VAVLHINKSNAAGNSIRLYTPALCYRLASQSKVKQGKRKENNSERIPMRGDTVENLTEKHRWQDNDFTTVNLKNQYKALKCSNISSFGNTIRKDIQEFDALREFRK